MAIDNVKLVKTVNKLSLFTGPVISTTSGGGGVSNGRTTNLEKAVSSGYVVTAGYAPFSLLNATASHSVTIWNALSGGTQITTVKNWDGSTAGSLVTDVDGGLFFQVADTNNVVYADLGSTRIKLSRIFSIVHGHVISDVTGLQAAIDLKSDTTHNHNATYQALSGKNAANGYVGLDGSSKMTSSQIPDISATYVATASANVANGYVRLDSGGVIPSSVALISSVNGAIGPVVLAAADVGAYTTSQVDALITNTTTLKIISKVSGSYPLRSTVSISTTVPVIWYGDTAPTIGSGYAIDALDIWFVKA